MSVARYALPALGSLLAGGALLTLFLSRRIETKYPAVGRFVTVEGGRLHYVEAGPANGETLGTIVLLHGASSNVGDPMLGLGRLLADRYRVIAIDRPGHGWSDRIGGRAAARPAKQAAVLADGLRQLGVRQAVVVGHSWGGAVTPNLALDHPDVTGAILQLSAVTHPWPGGAISWYYHPAGSALGWLFTRTLAAPLGSLLMNVTAAEVFAPQEPPPNYMEAARIPVVLRPPVFQANAQDVARLHRSVTEQSSRYAAITVPVTVIAGDADRIVATDLHSRAFARDVPGAKLFVLPGVGHMPHHAAPELVVAEIEALAAQVAGEPEVRSAL